MKPTQWIVPVVVGLAVTVSIFTDTWFYLLMATVGMLFVLFAIAMPRAALLVWLVAAPLANAYASVNLPTGLPDITFGRVTVTVVAIALLMRTMFKGAKLAPFGTLELAMLVLLAVMAFDIVRSGNPMSDALQDFDERVTPILLFLAARNLFGDVSSLKRALWATVLAGCYLAAHGGYQWATVGRMDTTAKVEQRVMRVYDMRVNESHLDQGRAVGPFTNGTEYGSVTAIAFLSALFIALYQARGVLRLIPVAALPIIGGAVVMSSTRSAWLGAYLALLLIAYLDKPRRALMLGAIGGVTIVGLLAAWIFLPSNSALEERASSLEPIRARLIMYNIGVRIAVRKPLAGYGRGAPSRIAARRELQTMGEPDPDLAAGQFHNIFMMTLVEWGAFAMLAYMAILALIVKAGMELRRRLAATPGLVYHFAGLFLAVAVVFITQGMFVDLTAFLYLNGLFFFFAGLMFAQLDRTQTALAAARERSYQLGVTFHQQEERSWAITNLSRLS